METALGRVCVSGDIIDTAKDIDSRIKTLICADRYDWTLKKGVDSLPFGDEGGFCLRGLMEWLKEVPRNSGRLKVFSTDEELKFSQASSLGVSSSRSISCEGSLHTFFRKRKWLATLVGGSTHKYSPLDASKTRLAIFVVIPFGDHRPDCSLPCSGHQFCC